MGDREQTRTPEYMIHDQLPASPVMETVTRRKRKLGRTGSFKMLRRKSEELLSRVRLRASMDSRKGRHSVAGHYTAPCGPGGSPGRSPFVLSSDDDNSPALSRNSSLRSESGLGFSPASSRGSFLDHIGITEEEYRYRQVVQCVLNPLGASDTRPGFRPKDLAQLLHQAFEVDLEKHEKIVKDVHNSRPSIIALNVTVVEAHGLRQNGQCASGDPYCVLAVCRTKTPHGSPRTSPRSSPTTMRRRGSSVDNGEVKKTQTIKSTDSPRWNEYFELDVKDFRSEELHVLVWDNNYRMATEMEKCGVDKPAGLKGLFKVFRSSVDYGRCSDAFLGQFRVPLRDIPATGCDRWYELYEDRKMKTKSPGRCRLKLELSIKQEVDQTDSAESDQCSIEDYHKIVTQMYKHTLRNIQKDNAQTKKEGGRKLPALVHLLPEPSQSVLHQFAVQNHFARITQLLMELIVILQLTVEEEDGECPVSEKLLKDAVVNVDMECLRLQTANQKRDGSTDAGAVQQDARLLITDTELSLFNNAASVYIQQLVSGLRRQQHCLPTLFPPCELSLDELKRKVSVVDSLLNLKLWKGNEKVRKDASSLFIDRLQEDARAWVEKQLQWTENHHDGRVISEAHNMVKTLIEATKTITPIFPVKNYFNRMGIDYFKVASMAIERAISQKAREVVQHLDQYQLLFHRIREDIKLSNAVSLEIYFALRQLYDMVRSNVSNERDLLRITIAYYQSWFEHAVMFWLQTFRDEGIRRMEKALEIEKDVVQVTSLVKHSNSSVDVLSCFQKIIDEWRKIDFYDADISLLGVTKITDMICDGSRQYAEKIEDILENNGYYDFIDNQQFDVTDQLCISLNNIAHVRHYLQDLHRHLNWAAVTEHVSQKHEDDSVGTRALETLQNLVGSADEDIVMRAELLLQRICQKMKLDLRRYTEKVTRSCGPQALNRDVDPLLDYLEQNLKVLCERMATHTYPLILGQLWLAELDVFSESLSRGLPNVYYKTMISHLGSIREYFHRGGVDSTVTDCPLYNNIMEVLTINAVSSDELMLRYCASMLPHFKDPPGEYFGQLAVKLGYRKETDDTTSVYIKVVLGKELPGMNRKGVSNPFTTVTLCPTGFFPRKPTKTQTVRDTVNPRFQEVFGFQGISHEMIEREGSVVIFSVWHYDSLMSNDFLGEVVLPLNIMRQMTGSQNIDDIPATMWHLRRPRLPRDGPFQVLRERSANDASASFYLTQRVSMLGQQPRYCAPVRQLLSRARGKKPEVKGAAFPMG